MFYTQSFEVSSGCRCSPPMKASTASDFVAGLLGLAVMASDDAVYFMSPVRSTATTSRQRRFLFLLGDDHY